MFVETPTTPAVSAGDRVDLASAIPLVDGGRLVLSQVGPVTVSSQNNPLPVPVPATSAELGDSGTRALALESVLVTVSYVIVTDTHPAPGSGDSSPPYEFVVDDVLRVDDALDALSPGAALGESFRAITGIHEHVSDHERLEPRSEADVVALPMLEGFTPSQRTYVRVGDPSGPTFPEPLAVCLHRAVQEDTTIQLTPMPGDVTLASPEVTIPATMVCSVVNMTGMNPDSSVSITATLEVSSAVAEVDVLPVGNTAGLADLGPASVTAAPGSEADFTVTLDAPPAADTVVSIAISPASGFATLPDTVTVPRNQLTAIVPVTLDAAASGQGTVSATLSSVTLSATVTAQSGSPQP